MNGTGWFLRAGVEPADLGYLPSMLDQDDKRPAREQLDSSYIYGGPPRWRTEPASIDAKDRLCYPGDPPLDWLAMTFLHDKEQVLLYPGDFVVILQPDRSFLFQRMD